METETKTLLDWALYYRDHKRWSVFPLGGDKKPIILSWVKYQTVFAANEEINQWFSNPNTKGIGIITGRLSGLVVLDIDEGANTEGLHLPPTLIAKTGGGGLHHYYKFPEGKDVRNSAGLIGKHIDVRAEGGYVVAPPSLHPDGGYYEWIDGLSPNDIDVADIPQWLLERTSRLQEPKKDFSEIINGVSEGRRNDSATAIAGKLLSHLPQNEWETIVWPLLVGWNKTNTPPLPPTEIRTVFESIANKELRGHNSTSKSKSARPKPLSVSDIFAMTLEPQPFLIDRLVSEKGLNALSGQSNGGKGWVTLHSAHCVATGQPLFGKFAVKQGGVLIIDEEAGTAEFHKRMIMLGIKPEDKIYLYSQEEFKVDNSDDLNHLVKIAKELEVKLVIFDPFSAIHLKNENSADEIQKVMAALQQFNLAGIAVIFVHHHRKEHFLNRQADASSGLRGSTVIFTRPDSHIAIKKDSEDENGLKISIDQTKLRGGQRTKPFTVELKIDEENNKASFSYVGVIEEKLVKKVAAKEFLSERLASGEQLPTDILILEAKEANIGKTAIEDALREMRSQKLIIGQTIPSKGKRIFYWLPLPENVAEDTEPAELDLSS